MSALNDIFMETYKEIDKHCRDMFVDEKGLGRYIICYARSKYDFVCDI